MPILKNIDIVTAPQGRLWIPQAVSFARSLDPNDPAGHLFMLYCRQVVDLKNAPCLPFMVAFAPEALAYVHNKIGNVLKAR